MAGGGGIQPSRGLRRRRRDRLVQGWELALHSAAAWLCLFTMLKLFPCSHRERNVWQGKEI